MAALRSGMSDLISRFRGIIDDNFVSIDMAGNEAAGQTVIELASTAGLKSGDLVVLQDTVSSELRTITSLIVDTSITVDAITNSYTTANSAKVTFGDAAFTDVEVQELFDLFRDIVDYELLEADVDFQNMWTPRTHMDGDTILRDGPSNDDTQITADAGDVFDFIAGRYTFNVEQTEAYYVKGYQYWINLVVAEAYRRIAENPSKLVKFKSSIKGEVEFSQKDAYDLSRVFENRHSRSLGLVAAGREERYD